VIAPPIIGWIQGATEDLPYGQYGYFYVEVFFIILSGMALLFNMGVYLYDKRKRENLLQSVEPLTQFERYT